MITRERFVGTLYKMAKSLCAASHSKPELRIMLIHTNIVYAVWSSFKLLLFAKKVFRRKSEHKRDEKKKMEKIVQ
jgi:hypothetical protein